MSETTPSKALTPEQALEAIRRVADTLDGYRSACRGGQVMHPGDFARDPEKLREAADALAAPAPVRPARDAEGEDALRDPDLVTDIRTASNLGYFKGHKELAERLLRHANVLADLASRPAPEGADGAEVHNHGTEEGPGLSCRERVVGGRLVGECVEHKAREWEPPRRDRLDRLTPAERAIRDAVQVVESAGCDIRLTEAINLLAKARGKVADFVDGIAPPAPGDAGEGADADWRAVAASFVLVAFGMGYAVPHDLARWADETAPREGHPITALRAALASRPADAGSGETALRAAVERFFYAYDHLGPNEVGYEIDLLRATLPAPSAGAGTPPEPDR